ncbi:MAG: carbohydrate ABC transporter permease [Anaerolineae bacterium]|nr:carbohydrate ABC transporter permease [Anaerolineae bacterium]
MTTITETQSLSGTTAGGETGQMRKVLSKFGPTLLALVVLVTFLMPLGYGISTSLKTDSQISKTGSPAIVPSSERTFTYEGETYEVYRVPTETGIQEWALVQKGREQSGFVDPANPEAGLIEWEGRWRTLDRVWERDIQWSNYPKGWITIDFLILLGNTLFYAVLSTFGAVASSTLVAYGFARFNFRGKNFLFGIVMATIILPAAVTLIPRYAFFNYIGWIGTWYPLIVPVYFANAYNVFLLRQFFLGIPRDLDEAATIDGASPFRIFWSVILPNAKPALTAVILFHFFFAWNDFLEPLIYLAGNPDKFPITVGLTGFNNLYTQQTNLIQAVSIISLAIPLVVFFFAQRVFLQGIQIGGAGVDK